MAVNELFYCKPRLNRWVLCMRNSLHEVCEVLNTDICHPDKRSKKKCR